MHKIKKKITTIELSGMKRREYVKNALWNEEHLENNVVNVLCCGY
jgi:hypothetical protein